MQRPRLLTAGHLAWRSLLLVAAVLVALQGLSSSLLAARGPLHAHVSAGAVDAPRLEDFRRAIAPTLAAHRHDGSGSDRHHHGDDRTVLALHDEAARAAAASVDDDSRAAHPVFLPLPCSGPCLPVDPAVSDFVGRVAGGWRSLAIAPPERPPRAG